MLPISSFRLLGLLGLLCPGALGDTTCNDVKTFYRDEMCCGYPNKVVDTGALCEPSTIDEIYTRGYLLCGVKETQYGMGYLDNSNPPQRSGLDVEYCKGVAAALNVSVNYIAASAGNRFTLLADKDIDVLIRTTTWTTERDVELHVDFAGINFFDGQSILVRADAFPSGVNDTSALHLNGAKVCVQSGTTSEGNVVDYFAANGLSLTLESVASSAEAEQKFLDNDASSCNALTGDKSAMVATMFDINNGNSSVQTWITTELLSKEPLAAATRDNDADFNEVVTWVWYGMVTAEEMGITSSNYETIAAESCADGANKNPAQCRFLTENLGLGTTAHPLDGQWMQHVLKAVGNYGEAYSRSFCDGSYNVTVGSASMNNCLIDRMGFNALVSDGGLQFAPPMRR